MNKQKKNINPILKEGPLDIGELASLTIDWLFRFYFKKHKKCWSHILMVFLMEWEPNPIKRMVVTRAIESSELVE